MSPDLNQLETALNRYRGSIAGVILTHNLGFPFWEGLASVICKYVPFVVDCCDALGAEVEGCSPVGSFSDMITYSFFPAHQINTAEGGAVTTSNEQIYETLRSFSNWGQKP